MTPLLVVLGAAVGAPLRYLVDGYVRERAGAPWGTFAVNAAGSGILGFLAALPAGTGVTALVGTGFCGALTTYSTLGYETLKLAQDGRRRMAWINVALSVLAGLGAARLGLLLAAAVTS